MPKIYLEVCRKNIKIFLLPAVFSVLLPIIIMFIVADPRNLRPDYAAVMCQQFFAWSGIFLLSPVFMPEQRNNIEETVLSKSVPVKTVYLIRLAEALITLLLFTAGFVSLLHLLGSEINFTRYFVHTFAVAFLLGSLSFAGTRFTGNIGAGYLITFGFYVLQMFLPVDRIETAKYFCIFTLIIENSNIIPMYICSVILIAVPFIKRH